MLINQMTIHADYEKVLKKRRWIFLAMLAVGVIGFACYFLLVPGSSLGDHARGFYLGAASGFSGVSIAFLIRTQYLITHPEARKKAKIKETDEREQKIMSQALLVAGQITFFVVVAALFVVLPLNMAAYCTLLCVMALYFLIYVIASAWLSKKL